MSGTGPWAGIPLSGRVIEPADPTRARAAAAGDPYDVVVTCAPRYTGQSDQIVVRRSQEAVAVALAKAGVRRADSSHHRGEAGAVLREPVQEEIRELWKKAIQVGISTQAGADLLGVTRAALYNILEVKVGTSPRSEARKAQRARKQEPLPVVKWPARAHAAHAAATARQADGS